MYHYCGYFCLLKICHKTRQQQIKTTSCLDSSHILTASPLHGPYHRRVKFDHLDKAFIILKLDPSVLAGDSAGTEEEVGGDNGKREIAGRLEASPIFRRVDLIVSPPDQYPFALVSWTGSKVHVATSSISPDFVIVRYTI